MDLGIGLFPQQRQQLSARQLQYLGLLALGAADLEEFIGRELEENPALERSPEGEQLLERAEWLRRENGSVRGPLPPGGAPEAVSDERPGLYEHLSAQLAEKKLSPELRRETLRLAAALDPGGMLEASETADDAALELLQSLEPAGVGARSVAERLTLQLRRTGQDTELAERIVATQLERLARRRFAAIAAEIGTTEEQVVRAYGQILSLDPDPVREFAVGSPAQYISPDVFLMEDGSVRVPQSAAEGLQVSVYYRELQLATEDASVREYLRERLSRAAWVVDAVQRRKSMLEKCAVVIGQLQPGFLEHGPAELRPMSMAVVAERLGVHESTVSRIVRGKYIQCPSGLYPMRALFSRALAGGASPARAKSIISELIAQEDKTCPYSDERLRELMEERGEEISRRTVAKYRAGLGIPPAAGRRKKDTHV